MIQGRVTYLFPQNCTTFLILCGLMADYSCKMTGGYAHISLLTGMTRPFLSDQIETVDDLMPCSRVSACTNLSHWRIESRKSLSTFTIFSHQGIKYKYVLLSVTSLSQWRKESEPALSNVKIFFQSQGWMVVHVTSIWRPTTCEYMIKIYIFLSIPLN